MTARGGTAERTASSSSASRVDAIKLERVTVERGGRDVLHELDASVAAGRVTGLFGPSGSGKSTLIRAIAGVQSGVRGSISVLGERPGIMAVRRSLGYMTQEPSVYDDLTVAENVRYFAAIHGGQIGPVLERVQLSSHANQLVRNLSGGQRARVSLAAALVGRPRLLLLDEPTVGLDPLLRRDLWQLFGELAAEGSTLLASSHVLDEARHCDEVILLRDGRLVAQLTPKELSDRTGTDDLASAFARTEFQVVQFFPLVILPQLLLCGLLVARDRMPSVLHAISDALPLSYAVDGMHHLSRQAGTGGAVSADIAIVVGFAAGALVLGAATLRRQTD